MRKCLREDILSLCRAGTIARVRHGRRVEGLNLKNSVVGRGAGVATAGRTGARISVSPRHPENSWAVNAKTSFRAVLYCGIDFRLELVVTVPVVRRASRLPHRASRPRCQGRGRDARPTTGTVTLTAVWFAPRSPRKAESGNHLPPGPNGGASVMDQTSHIS